MAPQIIIDNIERNLSVERTSHESTVFPSVISRPSPANLLSDEHLVTVDSRVLDKILEKCKKNAFFLRELLRNQTKFTGQTDVIVAKFAWNFSGKLKIIPVNWGKLCYNFGIMEDLQFGKFCQNGGISTEFLIQMLRNFSVNYH
ncbi:unnamed protein product [Rhizophagus irregularis]|uniref:Uncharacterized protein n=1 Tax=Rhizophagus irregularis TaxID=588596 RepID=A0A2N1M152_9GLOM|nr:hypothetical protein RhiirC2_802574 [Rhizophagus irregularis]CAB4401050.1 unnamed protein product [Rhizophagus irregularis]